MTGAPSPSPLRSVRVSALPLHRAIYVSDAVGDARTSLLVLAEILGASMQNNRRDGLTGVLMRHEGRFLQAIEGRRSDVDRLIDRLRADPRHQDVRLLSDQNVRERLFPQWPMTLVEMPSPALPHMIGATLDQLNAAQAEALLISASETFSLPA